MDQCPGSPDQCPGSPNKGGGGSRSASPASGTGLPLLVLARQRVRGAWRAVILRNGLRVVRRATELLQPEQHSQRALELTVEVDLVPAQPLYLDGVECLSKGLIADCWAMN